MRSGYGMKKLLVLLLLSACTPLPPAISDLDSHTVRVQASVPYLLAPPPEAIYREAERGCAELGKRVSAALSVACVQVDYRTGLCLVDEHLYTCK